MPKLACTGSECGIEHLSAVDPREPQVGEDDVEGELGEALDGVFAVAGLLDHEPVIGEPLGNRLAQGRLVVHNQQMFPAFRHLNARAVF